MTLPPLQPVSTLRPISRTDIAPTRSEQVLVRLTPSEMADARRLAETNGMTLPDLFRAGLTLFTSLEARAMTTALTGDNQLYMDARDDPITGPIMKALGEQDARTYNGNSGDKVELATRVAREIEPAIRRDERHRLATLLEEHHATLVDFPKNPKAMLDTIVFLLRLDHGAPDA